MKIRLPLETLVELDREDVRQLLRIYIHGSTVLGDTRIDEVVTQLTRWRDEALQQAEL